VKQESVSDSRGVFLVKLLGQMKKKRKKKRKRRRKKESFHLLESLSLFI
jgi:hypothetical protein